MHKKLLAVILSVLSFMSFSTVFAEPVTKEVYYEKNVTIQDTKKDQNFLLSLWDAETGGNRLWFEEKRLLVKSGRIETFIGDSNSLDNVDFSQQMWIQVELKEKNNRYTVLGKRDMLGVVPYALWSDSLGTLLQPSADRTSLIIGKGYSPKYRLYNDMPDSLMISFMGHESDNVPEVFVQHGRVGINTATPDEALEVHGNLRVSGQGAPGQGNLYVTGNTAVAGSLEVNAASTFKDVKVSNLTTENNAIINKTLTVNGISKLQNNATINGELTVAGVANLISNANIKGRLNVGQTSAFEQTVGIGINSPLALLHVKGS